MLDSIIQWATYKETIRVLILVGSRSGQGKTDFLSDYDISVFAENIEFIENDQWLSELGDFWVCIHDQFEWNEYLIPTRLVLFKGVIKVDFAFHHTDRLNEMISSGSLRETYDNGYTILLDKDKNAIKLPSPRYKAYYQKKPSRNEFESAIDEFWFEAYHVAKYLYRNDLWTAKTRDWATKKIVLRLLEWNAGAASGWTIKTGYDGKEMNEWINPKWNIPDRLFAHYDVPDSAQALKATMSFFSELAKETAILLGYPVKKEPGFSLTNYIMELLFKEHASS